MTEEGGEVVNIDSRDTVQHSDRVSVFAAKLLAIHHISDYNETNPHRRKRRNRMNESISKQAFEETPKVQKSGTADAADMKYFREIGQTLGLPAQKLEQAVTIDDIADMLPSDTRKTFWRYVRLGYARMINRYDISPRKILCVSKGTEHDKKADREKFENVVKQAMELYPKSRERFAAMLETTADGEEVGLLEIGKEYTLKSIDPDVGFGVGKIELVEFPDEGRKFNAALFEELHEVPLQQRLEDLTKYNDCNR